MPKPLIRIPRCPIYVLPDVPLVNWHRNVTVALPGWKLQVSAYEITQYKEFRLTGTQKMPDGRRPVASRNGIGYVEYTTDLWGGDIEVKCWPDKFSDPDFVLEMEQT